MHRELTIVGLSIMGGAFLLATIFFLIAHFRSATAKNWVSTQGIVVNRKTGQPYGMTSIYPTFQWRDEQGRVHQHTSSMKQSLGPAPGKIVPVRYDPANPSRAIIDTFAQSGRIFYPIALIIFTLGLSVGSFLLFGAWQVG